MMMKHQSPLRACERVWQSKKSLLSTVSAFASRSCPQHHFVRCQHSSAADSHLPRIAQSSLWETIFPKSIREKSRELLRPPQKKPINPASYFIWIYLLIGSQAIRILSLQNDFNTYMRRADLKIAKLREVVEKLQKGEPVDVEKMLGTGDETQELEWEEALKEIESEDRAWLENKKKLEEEKARFETEQQKAEAARQDASPISETMKTGPPTAPGFY